MIFAVSAAYLALQQTKNSRRPLKSVYVWMIWIELVACIIIAIECLLYLLYIIPPSFYFFMSILLLWSIQIHLLLQIIINRIRVILHDRTKSRALIIGVALFVLCINISVFCIWIPARLQISNRYIHINNIWDRVEKVLYLLLDGCLNWYFIRIVKQNLVGNGLQKYSRLVRFNQRIIILSLMMDVMIIGAMSIPNGFLYAMFHPLAFLVKLNIEMTMANLIRRIVLSNQPSNSFLLTFPSISSGNANIGLKFPKETHRHSHWIHGIVPKSCTAHGEGEAYGDCIVKTEEYGVVSRRRSQMSSHLLSRWGSQMRRGTQTTNRDSVASGEVMVVSMALEEVITGSGEIDTQSQRSMESSASEGRTTDRDRDSAAGDEVVLIAPPPGALTRMSDSA
ncbi:hypothetical protein PMIN06_002109 [Paraphaeosphaeria minitans]